MSDSASSSPKSRWRRLSLILLLLILAACAGAGWVVHDFLNSSGAPDSASAHDVDVTISPGTTFVGLSAELEAKGVVKNAKAFAMLARWKNVTGKLQVGRFRVNTGWKPEQVLDRLVHGQPVLERVTIPEGLAWWDVGKRLEEAGMLRLEDYKKIVHDPEFLRYCGIPFPSVEGFLYPDTYLLERPLELNEESARKVVARLVDTFWRKTSSLWPEGKRPGPQGADYVRKLVILASIVEKETSVPEERGLVAGVYVNRLQKGMLLQADPTTAYGLGENFDGRLLYRHLEDTKNMYNTYCKPGLPPGPICSPGLACLQAAANPAQHHFLYFVASGEGNGHVFSKTLAEHNRAVRAYRQKTRRTK